MCRAKGGETSSAWFEEMENATLYYFRKPLLLFNLKGN